MKIKDMLAIMVITITTTVSLFLACAEPPKPPAPVFGVVSLQVTPATIPVGEEATIIATVQNSGQVEGNYQAVLTVDGKKVNAKTVTIPAESSRKINFPLSMDTPGTYEITVGKANALLTVKKFVQRDVNLSYGSGDPRDFLFAGALSGFLIDFTPPDKSFQLKRIRICGGIYGAGWHGQNFEIFVLDSNRNTIFSQVLPITLFPQREHRLYQLPVWREVEVVPTNLSEKFYIYVYTDAPRLQGLHIGVDNSIVNEHCDVGTGTPPNLTIASMANLYPGLWCADRSKVTWLIQATGTVRTPE